MKIKSLIDKLTKEVFGKVDKIKNLNQDILELEKKGAASDILDKHYRKLIDLALEIEPAMHILQITDQSLEKLILNCLSTHYSMQSEQDKQVPITRLNEKIEQDGQHPFFDPKINYEEN